MGLKLRQDCSGFCITNSCLHIKAVMYKKACACNSSFVEKAQNLLKIQAALPRRFHQGVLRRILWCTEPSLKPTSLVWAHAAKKAEARSCAAPSAPSVSPQPCSQPKSSPWRAHRTHGPTWWVWWLTASAPWPRSCCKRTWRRGMSRRPLRSRDWGTCQEPRWHFRQGPRWGTNSRWGSAEEQRGFRGREGKPCNQGLPTAIGNPLTVN